MGKPQPLLLSHWTPGNLFCCHSPPIALLGQVSRAITSSQKLDTSISTLISTTDSGHCVLTQIPPSKVKSPVGESDQWDPSHKSMP